MPSILRKINDAIETLRRSRGKRSYSQSGEDLILNFAVHAMGVDRVTYLDVGAYHPYELSNTYLFYRQGMSGVLVEADPELFQRLRRHRRRDICVNAAVGRNSAAEVPFYVMSTKTLNTLSEAEASRLEAMGVHRIERVDRVPVATLGGLIDEYFPEGDPIIVSIDVEGHDFEILAGLDFTKHRPAIFCVETITYSETRREVKDTRIAKLMQDRGYLAYADTYINTIFVDEAKWRQGVS